MLRHIIVCLVTGAIGVTVAPANGCTMAVPYRPLTARPIRVNTTMLADVVGVDRRKLPSIAHIRVARVYRGPYRPGAALALPYRRSPCGESREPVKGQQLIVYVAADGAAGWATRTEAKRFDPDIR